MIYMMYFLGNKDKKENSTCSIQTHFFLNIFNPLMVKSSDKKAADMEGCMCWYWPNGEGRVFQKEGRPHLRALRQKVVELTSRAGL